MCVLCAIHSAPLGGGNADPRLYVQTCGGAAFFTGKTADSVYARGGAGASYLGGDSGGADFTARIASGGESPSQAAVYGLFSGSKWWSSTVSVAFPTSSGNYGYNGGGFQAFNTAQQTAVSHILEAYASFANLKFNIVKGSSADIRFAETNAYSTAYGFYPSSSERGGDVWVNSSKGWYDNPNKGDYAYFTLMHELGHALGLKHAHESPSFPSSHNGMPFTIMTYASYVGQGDLSRYRNDWASYAQTPMLDDMAAIQRLYGANFKYNASNTTYAWDPTNGAVSINGDSQGTPASNRIFMTMWDGGGTDTYDLSAYTTGVEIDLTPGAWSTFSDAQRAKLSGDGRHLAPGNVANAYLFNGNTASMIENAIGGSGNDIIKGNSKANVLDGRDGVDRMSGGKGNDRYISDGSDKIIEKAGEGVDEVRSSGNCTLAANVETLKLTGALAITGRGNASANLIIGNSADNKLSGLGGADTLVGGFGEDVYCLSRTDGSDKVIERANGGIDTVLSAMSYNLPAHLEILKLLGTAALNGTGNGLDNSLYGNAGANTLIGGAGNDRLYGQKGADLLKGGAGDDFLLGGLGTDTLAGGVGNDTYGLASTDDADKIIEKANGGLDTVLSAVDYILPAHVEVLKLMGSEDLNGTGNGLDNVMFGNAGSNTLNAGNGDDTLYGQAGADVLTGGAGSDVLIGGLGADTLSGGAGADRFWIRQQGDVGDLIRDFESGVDTLVFAKAVVDNAFTGTVAAGQFVLAGDPMGAGAVFVFNSAELALYFDADGSGAQAAVLLARFEGAGQPHAADLFIL